MDGKIKVIDNTYPVTVSEAVYVAGTNKTLSETIINEYGNPLYIPTPYGYNEPYHPSVLYFENKFNGYKYWMVMTEFPNGGQPYRDRYECPSVIASNDCINWVVPNGLINPIDNLTEAEISNRDYMSDCHLLYNSSTNKIECWYRISHNVDGKLPTLILRKTSSNGINWSDREQLIDCDVYGMVRSPSILFQENKYRMWFNGFSGSGLAYAESSDGLSWSNPINCPNDGGISAWHIDVNYINGEYVFINYTTDRSSKGLLGIHLYTSTDGINFTYKRCILYPSNLNGTNYSSKLYRACIIYDGNYKLFYTCEDHNIAKARIGLMQGATLNDLKIVNGSYHKNTQHFDAGIDIVNTSEIKSEILLSDKGTCIGIEYATEKVYIKKSDGTKVYLNT